MTNQATRLCGCCMQSQLAEHLLDHVQNCWPRERQLEEFGAYVVRGRWEFAAWRPDEVPPRPDTPYSLVRIASDRARLREYWEPLVLRVINLDVDGCYPLPRRWSWILLDLMGLMTEPPEAAAATIAPQLSATG